jgi:serine/threonine protein kinase
MLTFACPGCQKKLSVKEELAGKKDKCPGCGQPLIVPAAAAPSLSVAAALLPPGQKATLARDDRPRDNDAGTSPPSSNATVGAGKLASADPRLTDFLAPPQADDELGRLGKYRILKILGHGGMGVVYLAEDPLLKRKVAVKAMLPGLISIAGAGQRFLREAQSMAAVKHDHVVAIYQVDEDRGIPFLAMEFLVGETLDERLRREGKLSPPEVLRISREIAEGLEAAHSTGLIHRDIKPANIWLEAPKGRVKILDFGLVRTTSQDSDLPLPAATGKNPVPGDSSAPELQGGVGGQDGGLTQEGAIVGTPAYMAPEQARGETVDTRSDLFSLGCVLYRMLTGQQPFQGNGMISTLAAVVSEEPSPPARLDSRVPRELSDLVMKLLEKDADRRPSSASLVVERLQALEGRLSGRKARRRRMLLMLAVSLVTLAPLGWWLAGVLFRVEPSNGMLVLEVNDEAEARLKNGKLVLSGPDGKTRSAMEAGEWNKELPEGDYYPGMIVAH